LQDPDSTVLALLRELPEAAFSLRAFSGSFDFAPGSVLLYALFWRFAQDDTLFAAWMGFK